MIDSISNREFPSSAQADDEGEMIAVSGLVAHAVVGAAGARAAVGGFGFK